MIQLAETAHYGRFGKKARAVMDKLADKEVIVISTVPLDALEDRFSTMVHLGMSWTDELHETSVYISSPKPDNLAESATAVALPDVAARTRFSLDSLSVAGNGVGIIPPTIAVAATRDFPPGLLATEIVIPSMVPVISPRVVVAGPKAV